MTDRPILFPGPMVRALLEGRTTQTRRVLSRRWSVLGHSWASKSHDWAWNALRWAEAYSDGRRLKMPWCHPSDEPTPSEDCGMYSLYPPFDEGDRLWVREAWAKVPVTAYRASDGVQQTTSTDDPDFAAVYSAGWGRSKPGSWKPGIHMPRWASRLTLTVTDVRVQRLQDISEADAIAEGIVWQEPTAEDRAWALARASDGEGDGSIEGVWLAPGTRQGYGARPNAPKWGATPEFAFRLLWDSLNADRGFGWDVNPWVVALTFTVEKRNIGESSHV